MAVRLDNRQADFEVRFETLLAVKREATVDVAEAVAGIIADVRARGDVALLELTAKYDRLDADSVAELAVGRDEIDAALDFRNVSIVANYIKERTKNAQFIIISLRNNMFELADRLVGIYKTENTTKSIAINPAAFTIAAR